MCVWCVCSVSRLPHHCRPSRAVALLAPDESRRKLIVHFFLANCQTSTSVLERTESKYFVCSLFEKFFRVWSCEASQRRIFKPGRLNRELSPNREGEVDPTRTILLRTWNRLQMFCGFAFVESIDFLSRKNPDVIMKTRDFLITHGYHISPHRLSESWIYY